MYTNLFGKRTLDDVDNTILGARVVSGAGYMVGGCVHIPAIVAVAKSDLQGFWKFMAVTILGGNAVDCFHKGAKEIQKAAEYIGDKYETDESSEEETDPEEEENTFSDLYEVKTEEE